MIGDNQPFGTADWTDADGYQQSGCIQLAPYDLEGLGAEVGMQYDFDSPYPMSSYLDLAYKIDTFNTNSLTAAIELTVTYSDDSTYTDDITYDTSGGDVDWTVWENTLDDEKGVKQIEIMVLANASPFSNYQVFIDDVEFGEEAVDPYALTYSAAGIPGSILEAAS